MLSLDELSALCGLSRDVLSAKIGRESLSRFSNGRLGVSPSIVHEFLASTGYSFAAHTVAFVNLKGGIGKTTSAVTCAARAAQYGFNTCLLDVDPQASATLAFDCVPSADAPLFYDLWQEPDGVLEHALVQVLPHMALLPSALENGLLETSLADPDLQRIAVRGVCAALEEMGYDLMLVDCPPSLGTATISAICAADTVVIPVACETYSLNALALTLGEIRAIRDNYRLQQPRLLILVSRFDRRERASRELLDQLILDYPDTIVREPIRVSTEFNKALAKRETVFANNRNTGAKRDYDHFVKVLLNLEFT